MEKRYHDARANEIITVLSILRFGRKGKDMKRQLKWK